MLLLSRRILLAARAGCRTLRSVTALHIDLRNSGKGRLHTAEPALQRKVFYET